MVLLLRAGLDEQRIADIVIVQMKGDFVVPVIVGRNGLPDCDPRIFYEDVDLGARPPILVTDKTFNREPMVRGVVGP